MKFKAIIVLLILLIGCDFKTEKEKQYEPHRAAFNHLAVNQKYYPAAYWAAEPRITRSTVENTTYELWSYYVTVRNRDSMIVSTWRKVY